MEYPLIIYISVGLIYGLGIIGLIGIICKVWIWMIDKIAILTGVHKLIVEWYLDRQKKNVYTPKMKDSPFRKIQK